MFSGGSASPLAFCNLNQRSIANVVVYRTTKRSIPKKEKAYEVIPGARGSLTQSSNNYF